MLLVRGTYNKVISCSRNFEEAQTGEGNSEEIKLRWYAQYQLMKMKILLLLGFFLPAIFSFGQDQSRVDSLINKMCVTIKSSQGSSDSLRISRTYHEHLFPFLLNFPEEKRKEIRKRIFFRFQRNCPEFSLAMDKIRKNKGDWTTLGEKPETNLNALTCKELIQHFKLSYLEASGDTVHLKIDNGYWIETFKDGTFSKLKFTWVSECEFEIEFIVSDNEMRTNYSKPGEKYKYQIINKLPTYYELSTEIPGQNMFRKFKIYF